MKASYWEDYDGNPIDDMKRVLEEIKKGYGSTWINILRDPEMLPGYMGIDHIAFLPYMKDAVTLRLPEHCPKKDFYCEQVGFNSPDWEFCSNNTSCSKDCELSKRYWIMVISEKL